MSLLMDSEEIKNIVEALTDQQDIFGDDLLEHLAFDSSGISKRKKVSGAEVKPDHNIQLESENSLFMEDFQKAGTLDSLFEMIHECQKCALGATRTNFVFGVGNPDADLLLIGEAPGAEEDRQGIPFVGRAGKLLTDILKAIDFEREDVYIANILKCRPPQNRDPLPSEREQCFPYLMKQIELINPKVILCMGRIAANALLNKNESLTKLREDEYSINNIKVFITYHPAALLRNPNWKRGCWEDVQKVKKYYDEVTAGENG
jgi:DNA polymerase